VKSGINDVLGSARSDGFPACNHQAAKFPAISATPVRYYPEKSGRSGDSKISFLEPRAIPAITHFLLGPIYPW
jgi:hypothetical protein